MLEKLLDFPTKVTIVMHPITYKTAILRNETIKVPKLKSFYEKTAIFNSLMRKIDSKR